MKRIDISIAAVVLLACTGCTSATPSMPSYTSDFKAGMKDGCATADGAYVKNSTAFRENSEYHEGWFYGRRKCNPAQKER